MDGETLLLQLLDPLAADVGHVHVAPAQERDPRRLLGDELEDHDLVLGHADAPVVVHGGQLDVRARHLLHELVGAAAHRLAGEDVVADLLDVLLGQDHAFRRQGAREIGRDDQRRLLGDEHDTVGSRGLDVLEERPERPGIARGGALADGAHEAELHVLRRHVVAVVELHALAQVERPALVVGGVLPAERDAAVLRQLAVGGRSDQVVEHHRQVVLDDVATQHRVERLSGEARQGDGQVGLGLCRGRPGRGHARDREEEQ